MLFHKIMNEEKPLTLSEWCIASRLDLCSLSLERYISFRTWCIAPWCRPPLLRRLCIEHISYDISMIANTMPVNICRWWWQCGTKTIYERNHYPCGHKHLLWICAQWKTTHPVDPWICCLNSYIQPDHAALGAKFFRCRRWPARVW